MRLASLHAQHGTLCAAMPVGLWLLSCRLNTTSSSEKMSANGTAVFARHLVRRQCGLLASGSASVHMDRCFYPLVELPRQQLSITDSSSTVFICGTHMRIRNVRTKNTSCVADSHAAARTWPGTLILLPRASILARATTVAPESCASCWRASTSRCVIAHGIPTLTSVLDIVELRVMTGHGLLIQTFDAQHVAHDIYNAPEGCAACCQDLLFIYLSI